MIRNYIKMVFRTLKKNKGFTAINIFGLALGLAACLLIVFYVVDELSYDHYNTKADRIYRVNEDLKLGNNNVQYAVCMPPLAAKLKTDFPEVENCVRLKKGDSFQAKIDGKLITEDNIMFADPGVFNVFTLPMISGDQASALKDPNNIVLTESSAKKYFNSKDIVGRTITFNEDHVYNITGVIRDIPRQSHFKADFLIAMSSLPDSETYQWLRSNYNTYVLFRKGADPAKLQAAFPAFLEKYSNGEMERALHINMAQFEKSGSHFRLNLTALTDIHLHSDRSGELDHNSNIQFVYIFSAIAIFILLIACVNFMNLSTARSSNRAREVGVRKVLGSARKYLVAQFLMESMMITFAAAVLALAAAVALLPAFNSLSGKELVINAHTFAWLLPFMLGIVLVIGLLAGSYPAFFLSGFQPIEVLKGKLANGFKGSWLRSSLVVFQFCISIFLIIGTLVIYNQIHYIQTKDLGYNRNQVMVIKKVSELGNHAQTFKQEVKQMPGVVNATMTEFLPTTKNRNTSVFYKEATIDQKNAIFPQVWYVDQDYLKTLDMKLAGGRNFSEQMPTDSSGIIINETAAKFLGYKDPMGKILYKSEVDKSNITHVLEYHIIGVVKDFHFNTLHESIGPITMIMGRDNGNLTVRFNPMQLPRLLAQLKSEWDKMEQGSFEYSFMDQDFAATYQAEQRMGMMSVVFTVLAIVIACLGLFGLAAFAAEQRTKEIGIRKVLGASVSAIVQMLSKDFIRLVMIAIVVSTPIAFILMKMWLQNFAYRVEIQWWIMAAAGIIALIIAFATISVQSIKAALANPVDSLKNE